MIISNAAVSMNSRRSYSSRATLALSRTRVGGLDGDMACARAKAGEGETLGSSLFGSTLLGTYSKEARLSDDAESKEAALTANEAQQLVDQAAGKVDEDDSDKTSTKEPTASVASAQPTDKTISLEDFSTRMKFSILKYIMELLFGQQYDPMQDGIEGETLGDRATIFLQNHVYDVTTASLSYSEEEATSFTTAGTVETADGRSLDFNLNIAMTRSFSASVNAMSARRAILQDPLVIRSDENAPAGASISDQTFVFDIDGDGETETLQNLGSGYGFLALDKNGNGEIDDGTELFGALSGNGFADLSAYDTDGNGWIDEADDVYSKLRIFTINADGSQSQKTMKDADVGAIYLGHAPTSFTQTDDTGMNILGRTRRSGFFLHEKSGTAGVLQQVDLAVS